MKVARYNNPKLAVEVRRKGGKTVGHGTFRAKRHPNSPRLRSQQRVSQYHVI